MTLRVFLGSTNFAKIEIFFAKNIVNKGKS